MTFNRVLVMGSGKAIHENRAASGFHANVGVALYNAEADATLAPWQLTGGSIVQGLTLTSDVVYTLPTAADLGAHMPEMDVGDALGFFVTNAQAAAYKVTLAVNTNVTKIGTNNDLSVVAGASKLFTLVRIADSPAGTYQFWLV